MCSGKISIEKHSEDLYNYIHFHVQRLVWKACNLFFSSTKLSHCVGCLSVWQIHSQPFKSVILWVIFINSAPLIYIRSEVHSGGMKFLFPWLCTSSTPLEPSHTLDPYCCLPCMLRGEDKLFWLTQRCGCDEWAEREWEGGIQGRGERREIKGSAVVFVPSCGCAYATQVPARSTICSSQDTGALSRRTNTNTLLSLLSSLQPLHHIPACLYE